MMPSITTTIPVRNGEQFILETLNSLAAQTRRPDRVIVLDNFSTDSTPAIVQGFKTIPVEYIRHPRDLGLFPNFNRCLEFGQQTDYLHILHADDTVAPGFYESLTAQLNDCPGLGLAWCLDVRIDENGNTLSVSGRADGRAEVMSKDTFLARKAEIGNQAFCATLLKTARQPVPEFFPTGMPILGDMVYWAKYGFHCDKIVHLHQSLAFYRWHSSNQTVFRAPAIEALIVDEWRTMQEVEALRGIRTGLLRRMKLKGLLAVRSGIKAKRFRQLGNSPYAQDIVKTARGYTGLPLWLAGQALVETRELLFFKLGRRRRHPQNVFS